MKPKGPLPDPEKQEQILAGLRRDAETRQKSYRERALRMFPHVCGSCGREFSGKKLRELTVHHKDHNHNNNPTDGSNWELLCIYCHDHEHARYLDSAGRGEAARGAEPDPPSTYKAFADLKARLTGKGDV